MEGKDLTDKIDVWAFGVVLWELLSEQVVLALASSSMTLVVEDDTSIF